MKQFFTTLYFVAATIIGGTALAVETQQPIAEKLVSAPVSELKWRELPSTGGIKVADLRGGITDKGAYDAFVIFPAGKDNPYHYHSQNLPTVVLKGTFYAVIDGKRIEYPAGSFYNLPARMPHYSGCTKDADCLLFQYQADHFDLVPVKTKK
ncbi:cupin domain-containing protein [Iodobacter arcticus]|uniref:Cupin domain-containing protein n=1 Tax=Iodobacter arcticus TaxID=590593 RepID=A0ABW2R4D1_9NEIS